MARFPFTSQFGSGREYYAALRPDYEEPETRGYGSQPVPNPAGTQLNRLAISAVGAGILASTGAIRVGDSNVFSRYYMPAIRTAEEFFPYRIARTFQVSNFLSQFEDTGIRSIAWSPETISKSPVLQRYFKNLTGVDFELSANINRGVLFHQGQLHFGGIRDGKAVPEGLLLRHAALIQNKVSGAARFMEGYAYNLDVDIGSSTIMDERTKVKFFSRKIRSTVLDKAGNVVSANSPMAVIGGRTIAEHVGRQAGALGSAAVERFNLLSRSMGEFIPEGVLRGAKALGVPNEVIQKVVREGMGVKAGPAGKTLMKLAGKWGLVGGGLYFGYDAIDYIADQTIGMGPTKLAATTYVGARIGAAEVAEATGLSSLARMQEEGAPGSTDLLKLLSFPLAGLGAGLGVHFVETANLQQRLLKSGRFNLNNVGRATDIMLNTMDAYPTWFRNTARWAEKFELFDKLNIFKTKMFDKPLKMKMAMGAAAGFALIAPFLPGALVPKTSPEELRAIYSGEQLVPVRRGRFWEMGRTPWEGQNISYFRPHWYALMMSDAREKSIYGRPVSAIEKFYINNFTYGLEKAHYYDRPYPITGSAFEDFPLIGPLLAGTIGQIIKPPLRMHEEEYLNEEGYRYLPPGFGEHRATELGELDPGSPKSPDAASSIAGEQIYRFTEMAGLWGFALETAKGATTGESGFFSEEMQLESARRMYGAERDVWDRELGGGFGLGEILRRVFPRKRPVPKYNPIRNTMPEWLPGPGDRSPDFLHGDPYTKVTMGDVRLPGTGYEALYPELAGLSPEDYPDIHKFKILADVAPYSEKTLQMKQIMVARKRAGELTKEEIVVYDQIAQRQRQLMDKKEFNERIYEGEVPLTPTGALGKYWEELSHGATGSPFEYLTPFSPFSKFLHMRTAKEDYEQSVLYGTQNSFWQNPVSNFLAPFASMTGKAFGAGGVPPGRAGVRSIEQYFDALEYIKFSRLMEIARENRDFAAVGEFNERRQETLVGVNPYTHTYAHIFRALPRRERDYFNDFAEAADPETQAKILAMVPENQRSLFMARWRMAKAQDLVQRKKKGEALSASAENFIDETYSLSRAGGIPMDSSLRSEYMSERLEGESYADWYRRTRMLPDALQGRSLPGPDWVGWHPAVDLDDIKLKLVENLGYDMHDFDLWQSDKQNLARRPFITDDAAAEVDPRNEMSDSEISSRLKTLLAGFEAEDVDVSVAMYPSEKPQYNVHLDITHDRSEDAAKIYKRGI